MPTIHRILCPLDYSRFSQHALQQAVALARHFGADIDAIHVSAVAPVVAHIAVGAPIVVEPARLPDGERAELAAELGDFIKEVDVSGVGFRTTILEGNPATAIVNRAMAWSADLIVMGTHGRTGYDRLLLGSVAEKVLRRAPCPVLIVGARAFDAQTDLRTADILCAVDFSSASMQALDYATGLAAKDGPGVTVLHAVELLADGHGMRDELLFGVPEIREDLRKSAAERLHEAIPVELRDRCPIVEKVTNGKAWKEILRVADEEEADLIVLGVTGRVTADLMLFGSTTQHVLRQASCPVLTIRA